MNLDLVVQDAIIFYLYAIMRSRPGPELSDPDVAPVSYVEVPGDRLDRVSRHASC